MNGTPRQIELALGIPARFSVEMVDRLYDGVRAACDRYRTDLAGGDTTASVNGLANRRDGSGRRRQDPGLPTAAERSRTT